MKARFPQKLLHHLTLIFEMDVSQTEVHTWENTEIQMIVKQ